MTALLDFPTATNTSASWHQITADDFDTDPRNAVSLQVRMQLPAHYLTALLFIGTSERIDLTGPVEIREAIADGLLIHTFMEIESAAFKIQEQEGVTLTADDEEWLQFCRVKIAEAFSPCNPWAPLGGRR